LPGAIIGGERGQGAAIRSKHVFDQANGEEVLHRVEIIDECSVQLVHLHIHPHLRGLKAAVDDTLHPRAGRVGLVVFAQTQGAGEDDRE
jgi:hypothetical protein